MAGNFFCLAFLLAATVVMTIGTPHMKRHLLTNTDTVLVAASEEERIAIDDQIHQGAAQDEMHQGAAQENCQESLSQTIEDCLQGFEVQWVVYNRSLRTQTRSHQVQAMRELCRQHDHTLLCIHRALLFCKPSNLELNLIESRIGHQREKMLRECPAVRDTTLTTKTTTILSTTTTPRPPVRSRVIEVIHPPTEPSSEGDERDKTSSQGVRTDLKIRESDRRGYKSHSVQFYTTQTTPPSGQDQKQTLHVVQTPENLSNDTHSKLQAKKTEGRRPETLCPPSAGQETSRDSGSCVQYTSGGTPLGGTLLLVLASFSFTTV